MPNKNALYLSVLNKWINDPVWPGSGSVQKSKSDWSLAEDLSFYKIWFKSVNNFLRYPGDSLTDRCYLHNFAGEIMNYFLLILNGKNEGAIL